MSPVVGNPITGGLGTVALNHAALGANYEDQVTPIPPAQAAFTDGTGAADGLSVADGSYKVVFLAFPLEAYGSAADKAALVSNTLGYFAR